MRVARLRPEIYSLAVLTLGSTLCILAGLSVFYLNQADYNQEWLLLAGAVVIAAVSRPALSIHRLLACSLNLMDSLLRRFAHR